MRTALLITLLMASTVQATDLPVNQWMPMDEPNVGVQQLGWDEIRYCPELEGILFCGAYRTWTSENQNAIWLYRFKENRWHLLYTNLSWARTEMSSDGGHTSGKMFYDETRKVLVYGGLVSMSANDRMRTWVFDPRALVGWDASPVPSPNIEYNSASAYISDWNASFSYESRHGAWRYDAVKNQWSQLAQPGSGPPKVTDCAYDAKRKRVLCFGGDTGKYGSPKYSNDLWAFDITSNTWQKLNQRNPPPGRGWPQLAISPVADVMLMHAGFSEQVNQDGPLKGYYKQHEDTWVLNLDTLEWQELKVSAPPLNRGYSNHLAYDPVDNVFLYLAGWRGGRDHQPNSYSCCMYALKYQGKNSGNPVPATVEPAPLYDFKAVPKGTEDWTSLGGGVLSATGGWAVRPSLASSGSELVLAFGEYPPPPPNPKGVSDYSGVYAFRYTSGQWSRMGTSVSTDAEVHGQSPSVAFDSAGRPVIAYSSGKIGSWKICIKRFEKDWKAIGPSPEKQSALPALASGANLAVGWQYHPNAGCAVAVSEDTGSDWKADAPPLNVYPVAESRAQFLSLLRDSKNRLVAAWQEQRYRANPTPKQIHVRRMENGKWADLGGEVPISSPEANANAYALTIHGEEPAVAVCDAIDGGHAQLFVYIWSGTQWNRLGDALNVLGSDGGAFRPAICSDGKSVFVAWPEYLPGRPPLLFVKKWDGSKWALCGGPLNNMIGKGAATDPVMAVLNGKPVVAWTEVIPCGEKWQRVFVKMMK